MFRVLSCGRSNHPSGILPKRIRTTRVIVSTNFNKVQQFGGDFSAVMRIPGKEAVARRLTMEGKQYLVVQMAKTCAIIGEVTHMEWNSGMEMIVNTHLNFAVQLSVDASIHQQLRIHVGEVPDCVIPIRMLLSGGSGHGNRSLLSPINNQIQFVGIPVMADPFFDNIITDKWLSTAAVDNVNQFFNERSGYNKVYSATCLQTEEALLGRSSPSLRRLAETVTDIGGGILLLPLLVNRHFVLFIFDGRDKLYLYDAKNSDRDVGEFETLRTSIGNMFGCVVKQIEHYKCKGLPAQNDDVNCGVYILLLADQIHFQQRLHKAFPTVPDLSHARRRIAEAEWTRFL